jgi:hypothetical protein
MKSLFGFLENTLGQPDLRNRPATYFWIALVANYSISTIAMLVMVGCHSMNPLTERIGRGRAHPRNLSMTIASRRKKRCTRSVSA